MQARVQSGWPANGRWIPRFRAPRFRGIHRIEPIGRSFAGGPRRWVAIFAVSILFGLSERGVVMAEEGPRPTPEQLEFFETKIRPVLVTHCQECHSKDARIVQGGLRVDSREGLLKGGDTGPAVVPGKADASLLIQALRHDGLAMPPKGKLPLAVVRDFESWVVMGAPDPRIAGEALKPRTIDWVEGRRHWAFQPVSDPPVPDVKDANWPIDPLDQFVLAGLEERGLKPVADADRHTWLRRVSLDLTGLPPAPSEVAAFVDDTSPQAWEKVVDRLLQSRAFGERWARHWLDLTGYADMMGTSNNVFAQHAWRYRDYLINAFHTDKPFDRFVREQIAGDLLAATTPQERAENIVATGFLMVGDVEIVEPDKAKLEADHIDTQVQKIGVALLGMTLNCVRCHDHKFDPLALSDYYGIAGMLRSSPSTHKIPFGVWSMLNSTELPETPEQLAARHKLESDHAAKLAGLKADQTRLAAEKKGLDERLATINDPAEKAATAKRRDELDGQLRRLPPLIQHAEFFASKVPKAFAMRDGEQPADMPVYIRGNPYAPGAVVPRGVIRVASWDQPPVIPAGQSGRLQLADWLADRRNPLTPRVAVNRIWQKLFGEGLVRSVDYFGTRGERPTHPELLDHLASRFVRDGWSRKQLIRALVLSRAYRLSSVNDPSAVLADPDNRLLWRMNRQRLDAEALRDQLLAVSGELKPSDGGPALVLEDVENCGSLVQQGVNPPHYTHRKPRAGEEFVRTIYLPVMRTNTATNDRLRSFFDFVNPAQIAGQRSQTVAPTQSLFVMNNDLFRKRAQALADRLLAGSPSASASTSDSALPSASASTSTLNSASASASDLTDQRLSELWLRVFQRPITPAERGAAIEFLAQFDSPPDRQPGQGSAQALGTAVGVAGGSTAGSTAGSAAGSAARGPAGVASSAATDAGAATARESQRWSELCHALLASNEFLFRL